MKQRKILAIAFIVLAVIGFAFEIALLAQETVDTLTYFGHIAVLVNILADVWLAVSGVCILAGYGKGKGIMKAVGARVQGAVTTYLLAVSVIFWILFAAGSPAFVNNNYMDGFIGAGNIFNNAVMPILMLLVWIFFPVDKRPLGKYMPFAWILPVYAYFVILTIVGMASQNYVYGFLNPAWASELTDGVFQALLLAVCLVLVFALVFYAAGRTVVHLRNLQLAGANRTATRETMLIDDTAYVKVKKIGADKGEKIVSVTEEAAAAANGIYIINNPSVTELYSKPAENGDAFSQLVMGAAYESGAGVQKDYETAAEWYAKAAENGSPEAINNLGVCYENGKGVPQDYAKAAKLYKEAARKGDANAEYNLANLYHKGAGVDQNYVKAAELYQAAAEKGHAKAQNNIADCYENGYGVSADAAKAAEWNKKAAEQGNAAALNHSGITYENAGYPRDTVSDFTAGDYQAAADNGDAEAQFYTGLAYEKGLGVQKDGVTAAQYYYAAAEAGNAKAKNKLGNCYYNGQGVPQDYERAAALYQSAAEAGDPNALYNLGNCYYNGWGVPQDYQKAASLYSEAAAAGNAKARNNLANCYENGLGVQKDAASAEYLYDAAAEQGQVNAVNRLGICYEAAGYPDDPCVSETAAADLQKRAEKGSPATQLLMGVSRETGTGAVQNYAEAAIWYEKSANGGNADAANNLAVLTQYGRGVPQDYERAAAIYQAAADAGNANALYNLGNCYYNGWGVPKDSIKAAKLYKKAAEQGHAKAQNNLAYLYETGDGVRQNPDEAARLYEASAAQGNAYAENRKGLCLESAEYPERPSVVPSEYATVSESVTAPGISEYEAQRQADLKAGKEAMKAAEEAERKLKKEEEAAAEKAEREAYEIKKQEEEAAAEKARIAEEEAAAVKESEREFTTIENLTVINNTVINNNTKTVEDTAVKEAKADDEEDESSVIGDEIIEVPDGYTYQDGWYYISETGERVETPIVGVGVRDEFYFNLPDELKPEFRNLFVDGTRVQIPRFPSYVVDGDNTMFFRLVFTFITRYRKVISIALLDNLYEYLHNRFSASPTAISKINDKLIRVYFSRRKEEGVEEKCEAKCREDIDFCLKNVPNYPANLYSYKRLVMILEATDRLQEARALCVNALDLGLVDGTKAGYAGRIKRIDKKLAEEANQ
ncbi:MAG: hypothetical protein LBP62_02425 [Clostridiales bacterium]|jgi:TPR repeat protein|nr:hypothetical protein [Clostridiales bacterium]